MSRRQAGEQDCERLREVAAEFVLGTLDGYERADVVEHLADCARCRDELSSLSGAVSDLALLAPRMPPSAGFTHRVLAAMGAVASPVDSDPAVPGSAVPIGRAPSLQRSRWRRPVIALVSAAAAVMLVLAGLTVVPRSAESRGVLAVAAMLDSTGATIGTSSLADGEPGTVHVSVTYPSNWLDYRLEAVDAAGTAVVLGQMHLRSGSWQWSGRLPAGELRELRIVRPDGRVTCQGALPS